MVDAFLIYGLSGNPGVWAIILFYVVLHESETIQYFCYYCLAFENS